MGKIQRTRKNNKPATGVYRLRGGRGGRPRAKRTAFVSTFVAHTAVTAAAMTTKRDKVFIAPKARKVEPERIPSSQNKYKSDLSYLFS